MGIVAAVTAPAVGFLGYRWRYSGNPFRVEGARLWNERDAITAQWRAMLDKVEDMFNACLERELKMQGEMEDVRADNVRLSSEVAGLHRRVHRIENGGTAGI